MLVGIAEVPRGGAIGLKPAGRLAGTPPEGRPPGGIGEGIDEGIDEALSIPSPPKDDVGTIPMECCGCCGSGC